jgi:hypothetical protein
MKFNKSESKAVYDSSLKRNFKSLDDYSKEIRENAEFPNELATILLEMTHDYASVCNMLIPIEVAKMKFWLENKNLGEKPVSDKTLEMMWMAVDDEKINGQIQRRAEMYKKALEKLMSSLKAVLREREVEARNQY